MRTSFLLALMLRTPDKDKLFYGDDKVSHYLIQIPDRRVWDNGNFTRMLQAIFNKSWQNSSSSAI